MPVFAPMTITVLPFRSLVTAGGTFASCPHTKSVSVRCMVDVDWAAKKVEIHKALAPLS